MSLKKSLRETRSIPTQISNLEENKKSFVAVKTLLMQRVKLLWLTDELIIQLSQNFANHLRLI